MRPHEGAHHIQRVLLVQLDHQGQLFQLRRCIETVAAFAFDGSHAKAEHRVQPLPANRQQILHRGLPGGLHTVDDAAAPFHDLHIGIAAQTPGKLLGPMPGKQEMRMRINETRQYTATGRVNLLVRFDSQPREDFAGRSHLPDDPVFQPKCAVFNNTDVLHGSTALRSTAATGHQFRRIFYQQCLCHV